MLHGDLLVTVLMFERETLMWREMKRTNLRVLQVDNHRSFVRYKDNQ